VIYLEVCRSPPGSLPQIRLVPDTDEPKLLCHRILKWPIQGRTVPLKDYPDPTSAMVDALAVGYQGDALQLLADLEAALLN
jgi:hypothetical protein